MLPSFSSLRNTGIYGKYVLSVRSLLQPPLRKIAPCSTAATIHTTRIISSSINTSYDYVRRGTRSPTQTHSRRSWTPEEDALLEKLFTEHGPMYSYLASHFTNRSPSAIYCRSKIIFNSESDKTTFKVGPWDKDELETLRRLTKHIPEEMIQWEAIQNQLPRLRNINIIKQTWYHSINPKWNHGRWTENETRQLERLVIQLGVGNWCQVSDMLGSRSPRQCLEKYRYSLTAVHKGQFTPSEDDAILAAVEKYGSGDFMLIQQVTNSARTPRQISQHYRYYLDPAYDRSPWSKEERMELYNIAQTIGSKDMMKIREQMNSKRHVKDMRNQYMLMKRSIGIHTENSTDSTTPPTTNE